MSTRSLNPVMIRTYLESLPEAEVAAIFQAVTLKAKRRWEFWLGIFLSVGWCIAWIWVSTSFGLFIGMAGAFLAMLLAAALLWPYVRWVNNRVLRDEVALRIAVNGV